MMSSNITRNSLTKSPHKSTKAKKSSIIASKAPVLKQNQLLILADGHGKNLNDLYLNLMTAKIIKSFLVCTLG